MHNSLVCQREPPLFMQRLHQQRNVRHEQPHGDSQQNDTEEFTDNVNAAFTEETFHTPRHTDHEIYP